jgi:hypothetical protein
VGVRNLFAGTWNVEVVVLACTFEVFFFSQDSITDSWFVKYLKETVHIRYGTT